MANNSRGDGDSGCSAMMLLIIAVILFCGFVQMEKDAKLAREEAAKRSVQTMEVSK